MGHRGEEGERGTSGTRRPLLRQGGKIWVMVQRSAGLKGKVGREPDGSMAGRLLVTGQGGKGATGWSSVTKMRREQAPQALLLWGV